MLRTFKVKTNGTHWVEYQTVAPYGRLQAARDYVEDFYPGFLPISGGDLVSYNEGRAVYFIECIDKEQSTIRPVWVMDCNY